MAFYGSLGEVNFDNLDASIADTAVDVFVYDTRKDSDGGAWRKRTQHTSWYNETLNTATRGSKREFPAVAVIVLTGDDSTSQATIYDGDNPDLPMWMVIPDQSIDWASNGGAPTSIAALNGILSVTCKGSGIVRLNFVKDFRDIFYSANYSFNNPTIVNRSDSSYSAGSSNGVIVTNQTNDVAMTVLPNAPIDPATGLPVPTIAVATNSGVSVIKDDESVVDSAFTTNVNYVSFSETGDRLFISRDDSKVFTSTKTSSISSDSWGNDNEYYRKDASNTTNFPWINEDSSGASTSRKSEKNIFGSQYGLTIVDETPGILRSGMGAWIASDYNTGWMQGDIKGAFLSDTDATNVTGTELWPEGDFADANEWSSAGAEWTISGGTATVNYTGGGYSFLGSTTTTLTNGKKYILSFTISNYASGRLEASQANSGNIPISFSANGSYSQLINYTGTTGSGLGMYGYGGGAVGFTLDNLYLRELEEEDRSVNNTGLAVYGTITKSAVATGAELVGYGPFSTSNRLQQPYNSDFNFGTNDFSVMFWFKSTASGTEQFVRKGNPSDDVGCFESYITSVGGSGNIRFVIKHTDGSSSSVLNAGTVGWNNGIWHHYVGVRRSGGSMELYLNGVLSNSNTTTYSVTNTSSSSILDIGSVGSLANGASNSYLSLIRISGSAPSPEQIKKIYEDEKVLFQENAACTLYGSSDAVTALAYDEDTDLLHVGTSSGRSDFQGLKRINNTTTAVTTAISASDGLIVEQ